ncbi:hypothetical protein MMC31_000458 [Peltigera leucophlebia]|nr:hypothetical protein [Peltigera leucophlebia]
MAGLNRLLEPRGLSLTAPIVIPANQDFDGNDGPWSSFVLRVGTPAQTVKVTISTAGSQTWVVLPEVAPLSIRQIAQPQGAASFIGNNGEFGYDTVRLGWQGSGGPSLDQQVLAGIVTKQFFLGVFGLNPRPTNFSNFSDPSPSYISNLKEKSLIPSLSWSYAAGNRYRLNKVLGSLTLGGYDSSRFVPNNVSFTFNEIDSRDLTVVIKGISVAAGGISMLLSTSSIAAYVDSTISFIYLPMAVCKKFEAAFELTWNDEVQAYLVNDTLNDSLKAQNATVVFELGNWETDQTVNISLPYAAFDLIAEYPLMPNRTRYFPLVRATNDTQYTLGRAFLQEAYLIADYERSTFSISQCNWDRSLAQSIVAIPPLPRLEAKHPSHSSTAAIAGIVVGTIICLGFLLFISSISIRRFSSRKIFSDRSPQEVTEPGMNDETLAELSVPSVMQELDGRKYFGPELDGVEHIGYELDGLHNWIPELPAREEVASETHA